MSRPRTEVTAYAGLASSILAVALVLGAPTPPWLGLAGACCWPACRRSRRHVLDRAGEAAAQAG